MLTYKWTFDTNVYVLVGTADEAVIRLAVKPGVDAGSIVSPITVEVSDENGCVDIKTCYKTPTGMQCADDYVACPNINNLRVTSVYSYCAGVSNLIVSKQ